MKGEEKTDSDRVRDSITSDHAYSNLSKVTGDHAYSKAFTQAVYLEGYKNVYRLYKPYPYGCDVCSMAFNRANQLWAHKRIHAVHKPFLCDVCCKSYPTKNSLKAHKKRHTCETFMCNRLIHVESLVVKLGVYGDTRLPTLITMWISNFVCVAYALKVLLRSGSY